METCAFALWKFKTVEGILQYWRSSEFDLSKYELDGEVRATIKYNRRSETATVRTMGKWFGDRSVTVPFKDLVAKLKELGLYVLRDRNACHESALIPFSL